MTIGRRALAAGRLIGNRLHRDERGVTSIMSLVAVLVFTMLLVMLTNIVRHLDDKVRMQNAADAASYSGCVILAQGMNSIAFTNHLEAETFALVALLRTLESRGSQPARELLPVMQYVLGSAESLAPGAGDHLLTNYQRDVLRSFPAIAQEVTNEISLRHGLRQGKTPAGSLSVRSAAAALSGERGPQWGVLWRSSGIAVGQEDQHDPLERTLPLIDPNTDGTDLVLLSNGSARQAEAIVQRHETAVQYLRDWVEAIIQSTGRRDNALLVEATLRLEHLLNVEYPTTNLPLLLRSPNPNNNELQRDYAFLGVSYRQFDREHGPRLFRNPIAATSDALAFAQAAVFLPKPRNVDPWPIDWNSFNQTWSAKLVPADAVAALQVLQSRPPAPAGAMRPLHLEDVQPIDIERVNTH